MARPKSKPGVIAKIEPAYYGCDEVMVLLGCKQSKAYQVIRGLRQELLDAGKISPLMPEGKIPKKYFCERLMING